MESTRKVTENDNFPLTETWKIALEGPIYASDAWNKWIAVLNPQEVIFIDIKMGEILWKKQLSGGPDSTLHFSNDFLVAQNKQGLYVYDEFGNLVQEIKFSFGAIAPTLLGIFDNHVFVLDAYRLYVFDLRTGVQVWEESVKRGFMGLTYDDLTRTVYAVSLDYLRAYRLETGEVLWNIDEWARAGVFADGHLYYCGKRENDGALLLADYDINRLEINWKEHIVGSDQLSVYGLTVLDNLLIATTNKGLYAVNKITGAKSWVFADRDSFYTQPIMLNDVIYAKSTTTNIIYAISPETGQALGSLRLEKLPSAMPIYMFQIGLISSLDEQLIIITTDSIHSFNAQQLD
jgi:outer membrane protein assembly factor BamB